MKQHRSKTDGSESCTSNRQLSGALNINKPPGMSSRMVVDQVAKLIRPHKAGHAGTLDPMATGVLVVCLGPATRLVRFVQDQVKVYRASFLLGKQSPTDDTTGALSDVPSAREVTQRDVEEILPRFVGRIQQVPPQYSAVHVAGRRAYWLARQGKPVHIEPRTVEIFRLEVVSFDYPRFELEIECGSGTYVRSLGRDIGRLLGTGAVMSRLVRTRIGPYRLEEATPLEPLDRATVAAELVPPAEIVEHLPTYRCGAPELDAIIHGCPVGVANSFECEEGQAVAVIAADDQLACLGEFRADTREIAPTRVFIQARASAGVRTKRRTWLDWSPS
jgi:tRNA pseudouridine55 synthase